MNYRYVKYCVCAVGVILVILYLRSTVHTNSALHGDAKDVKIDWIRQFGTIDSDFAYDVAADNTGGVIIVGNTYGRVHGQQFNGESDAFISKYSQQGVKIWSRVLGSRSRDSCYAVTTDRESNIYVVGEANKNIDDQSSDNWVDTLVAKYTSDGESIWVKQFQVYRTPFGDHDWPKHLYNNDIALDQSGNVYIIGSTGTDLAGNASKGADDIYMMKYDSDGAMKWTKQMGTVGDDLGFSISVGPEGNLIIAGYTEGDLDGQVNQFSYSEKTIRYDAFVSKYDAEGVNLWTRLIGTKRRDVIYDTTFDHAGNVYVVGATQGKLGKSGQYGRYDIFVAKYDTDGHLKWIQQEGVSSDDIGCSIAFHPAGFIYIAGVTGGDLDDVSNDSDLSPK